MEGVNVTYTKSEPAFKCLYVLYLIAVFRQASGGY